MSKARLSQQQACKLALLSQGIHRQSDFGAGKAAALSAIQQLGYVQIDTISVVERAHHHVLWSRCKRYQSAQLGALMKDRKVFEYWSHAAAYLPMQDYRYSLPRKRAIASGEKHWHPKDPKITKFVLDRINAEGPLQAKDFEHSKTSKSDGWWDWKPAKRALERLFMEGELMVSERRGFQKVYDLTERVLPENVNTSLPSTESFAQHLIMRYLSANGLGTPGHMAYLRKGIKPEIQKQCDRMAEEGVLQKVAVGGLPYYVLAGFEQILRKPLSRTKVRILSPFDNLLIQRKRTKALFGFDYQIECYVPAEKRVYGYFVLPLLWGQQFAGRLDAKIDRKNGVLSVRNLHIETEQADEFVAALKSALDEFMVFNAGNSVKIDRITTTNDSFASQSSKLWVKMLESPQN